MNETKWALCFELWLSNLADQIQYVLFSEEDLPLLMHVLTDRSEIESVYLNMKMIVTCLPKYLLTLFYIRCPHAHIENYYIIKMIFIFL